MDDGKLKFPPGFFWGAATSSHQVEGGTRNNWSEWEKANAEKLAEKAKTYWKDWQRQKFPAMLTPQNYLSGRACDHYNLYEKDFDIAKSLSHNAHRLSIEWSRIEPSEGKFDEKEVEHYQQVIKALRARGMEPFVTLCHFTLPVWIAENGELGNKKFSFFFSRYAGFMADKFGKEVKFWITFNEPTCIIAESYLRGLWPPQRKNPWFAWKAYGIFARAHKEAYEKIHAVSPNAEVGFANNLHSFESYRKNSWIDKACIVVAKYLTNRRMLNLTKGYNDFLTVQYYFHNRFKFPRKISPGGRMFSDLNWEIYPYGIYRILMKLKEHNLPIYITENGVADADDNCRADFISDHLSWVSDAIADGADVRGYFYWSLLDNFEWDKGFWPRFGLVEVDYWTMERKIRPSAHTYKEIIDSQAGFTK